MAQYILPGNQRLLWTTLHESTLFARVFPQLHDQSTWFQQIVQGIYEQHIGGRPISLSQAALEEYNRYTMMYMMQELRRQSTSVPAVQQHTTSREEIAAAPMSPFGGGNTLASIAITDLRKPPNGIELRLAEHQRDLDHYLGEKRPTEIDFRMDTTDTPLDTTDIEALLKQQKEQRMTIDNLSPPPLSPPPPPILNSTMISNTISSMEAYTSPPMGSTTSPPLGSNTSPPMGSTTSPPMGSNTHIDDLYKSMEDNRQNMIQIHNDHKDMKTKMDDLYKRLEQLERLSRIYDTDSDSASKQIYEESDDDVTIGDTTETSQNGVL